MRLILKVFWVVLGLGSLGMAAQIHVAGAANLTKALEAIKQAFLKEHPNTKVYLSFGSSGKLYNQIHQGAPFDLFVSADKKRPMRLVEDKITSHAIKIYAKGVLVLWSKSRLVPSLEVLRSSFTHLAMANPMLAPYGRASMEVLEKLKLTPGLKPKILLGNSIAQANQYVASGGAELGFSALSLMDRAHPEHYYIVPKEYYSPIEQALVLTNTGGKNSLARAFEQFLLGPKGKVILKSYGYIVD
ncbi:molybdate ABC transporter substrate-binding protein [Helicobacter baculiformis]|uniref:Molybdate ABC transporter substrate-binding protein n=1 Tax=Helicobacter baculiformis TaxID=427351 RepID=A0ABV7ZJP1_9HELI|nr:molybdate ABC transporter substrate-binding protein [Helicobacter baculiformis]